MLTANRYQIPSPPSTNWHQAADGHCVQSVNDRAAIPCRIRGEEPWPLDGVGVPNREKRSLAHPPGIIDGAQPEAVFQMFRRCVGGVKEGVMLPLVATGTKSEPVW